MARSRRLGIAGEVSVWQIPENGVCTSPCQHGKVFFFSDFFFSDFFFSDFSRKNLDGAFSYGKNDQ